MTCGGIVGSCRNCVIEKSESYGRLAVRNTRSENPVSGGIVGLSEGCNITRCVSDGNATTDFSAGIVGNSSNAYIQQCYWSEEMGNCTYIGTANISESYPFNNNLILNNDKQTPLLEALRTLVKQGTRGLRTVAGIMSASW